MPWDVNEWGLNAEPELQERVAELQRYAAERRRGPIPVTAFQVTPNPAVLRRDFTLPGADEAANRSALDSLAALVAAWAVSAGDGNWQE